MLIRVRGHNAGIKAYLENGQKQGRDMARDDMDERVILAGDLQLTHEIIETIDTTAERYLTVTLSFKEDDISPSVLERIVTAFERFAFAAYRRDEYVFYAEAHLPKIKSYANRRSGEVIERKPHIHIVIPTVNLLSGRRMEPFGLVGHQQKYIDAFQEHINHQFGLASPKDNRRVEFTDASDMISRYKGDVFEGSNAGIKNQILQAVLERNISSMDAFRDVISEFGETRTRNADSANEYVNVKPAGALKGVNLKEFVFSRQFIELDAQGKQAALSAENKPKYETAGGAKETPPALLNTLREWNEVRAREVKYLNGAFRSKYREMSSTEQRATLLEREQRFYQKYDSEDEYEQRSENDINVGRGDGGRAWGNSLREQASRSIGGYRPDWELNADATLAGAPAESRDRMRDLSRIGLDGIQDRRESVLSDLTHVQLEQRKSSATERLRRNRTSGRARSVEGAEWQRNRKTLEFIVHDWREALELEYERYRVGAESERRAIVVASANKLNRTFTHMKGGRELPDELMPRLQHTALIDVTDLHAAPMIPGICRNSRKAQQHTMSSLEGQDIPSRRRSRHIDLPRNTATGRIVDSLMAQLERDRYEAAKRRVDGIRPEFQQIKQDMDARRLLGALAHSHGVMPEKYQIWKGRDGADRIKCGSRNYNVTDFLTKEINLPWDEASQILRRIFREQVEKDPDYRERRLPQERLWAQFQANRRETLLLVRDGWKAQGASERARYASVRDEFLRIRTAVLDNTKLTAPQKRAAMSAARFERAEKTRQLRAAIERERIQRRELTTPRLNEHYRSYLRGRANAGDETALAELRRIQQIGKAAPDPLAPALSSMNDNEPNVILYDGPKITREVRDNGDVTYSVGGSVALDDEGQSLRIWSTDESAVQLALRMSAVKFGNIISVSGPDDFREAVALAAADAGMRVNFDDRRMNELADTRRKEIANRQQLERERELARLKAIERIEREAIMAPPERNKFGDSEPDVTHDPDLDR